MNTIVGVGPATKPHPFHGLIQIRVLDGETGDIRIYEWYIATSNLRTQPGYKVYQGSLMESIASLVKRTNLAQDFEKEEELLFHP